MCQTWNSLSASRGLAALSCAKLNTQPWTLKALLKQNEICKELYGRKFHAEICL